VYYRLMSTLVSMLISLVIGLIASLIWVLLLFWIKPRLTVEVTRRRFKKQPAHGWAFTVTNSSRVTAVQVQARLWRITPNKGGYTTRTPVKLKTETLFQLPGRWGSARRTAAQRADNTGSNAFRFLTEPPTERLEDCLGDADRLLFQVWAQHGFTNFGRVKTFTITKADLLQRADRS
jgi:hypothetical protein